MIGRLPILLYEREREGIREGALAFYVEVKGHFDVLVVSQFRGPCGVKSIKSLESSEVPD